MAVTFVIANRLEMVRGGQYRPVLPGFWQPPAVVTTAPALRADPSALYALVTALCILLRKPLWTATASAIQMDGTRLCTSRYKQQCSCSKR